VEIQGERLEDLPQRAAVDPGLEAAMTRLIGGVPVREIHPRRARAQDPEDAVQHVARIPPRPAAPIATQARFRQERRENRPLGVGKVHTAEYDGRSYFVHSRLRFMR
jgi:hypothetical protein